MSDDADDIMLGIHNDWDIMEMDEQDDYEEDGYGLEGAMDWMGRGETLYSEADDREQERLTMRTHESRAVPETLDDAGGLDQSKVTNRILLEGVREQEPREEYGNVCAEEIKLSTLLQMWENENASAAMRVLFKKHRLVIDDEYLLHFSEGNVVLNWKGAFQDYKLIVPRGIGLHAALPNLTIREVVDDPSWNFTLHVNRRHWEYRGDCEPFGFDPARRMLYLGQTSSGDDVWLVWAPRDSLGMHARLGDELELSGERTTMDPVTARVMMAMLCWMLESINYSNVATVEDYPDVASNDFFGLSTNFLTRHDLQMDLDTFSRLNDAIKMHYRTWYEHAPNEYKQGVVKDSVPCCIRIRYGQNRRIACDGELDEDASHWEKDYDLPNIARIQMAIAKHYAAFEVEEWEDRNPDAIMARHGVVYTTEDEETREEVDHLDELALVDRDMQEIPIFDEDGKRVPRRKATLVEDEEGLVHGCGLLQDLSVVSQLFDAPIRQSRSGSFGDQLEDNYGHSRDKRIPLWYFSHFFSSKYGQWQADGVMDAMQPPVDKINQRVRAYEGVGRCVEPVRSQCYNTYAHETRASAKLHVAQRGMLTATVGGAWEGNQKGARTAKTLFEQSDKHLPHDRLEAQTDKVAKTYLRLEEEFIFHITRFAEEHQNGRAFYEEAIQPLIKAGKRMDVLKGIKRTTVVFKPEIWPRLYSVATYPVTSLIRAIWDAHLWRVLHTRVSIRNLAPTETPSSQAMRLTPMPFYLEWIAILERCLNFAYTGAAKVICYKLMNKLWAGQALRDGLMPVLWDGVFMLDGNGTPKMAIQHWPVAKDGKQPLVASQKALTLTYGKAHFLKYWTHLTITKVASKEPVSTDASRSESARLHEIALLAVDAYIEDVRELVKTELRTILDSHDFQEDSVEEAHVRMRWRLSEQWKAFPEPLAWGPRGETYMTVVRMVVDEAKDIPHGVPVSSTDKCSLEEFVGRIFKMGTKTTLRSVQAPLVRTGSAWPVLAMVIRECRRRLGEESEASDRQICKILVSAFKDRKVEYVPDKLRDGMAPTTKAWTILSEAHGERTAHLNDNLQTPSERREFQLAQLARDLSQSAVNADWEAMQLRIGEYHKYLTRTARPFDWSRDSREKLAEDVADVYDWADGELKTNFQSWKCQLAVVLAFLVSKVLPNVHLPSDDKLKAVKAELQTVTSHDQERAISIVRKIEFTSKDVGGSKNQKTYFTIGSMVILAMIVSDSPLRKRLAKTCKLDDKWTSKHRAKAMVTPTLIRLGVLKGHGQGLLRAAKWGQWNVRDDTDLRCWYDEIVRCLQNPPHGPYRLVAKIFGPVEAERQAARGEFPGLPAVDHPGIVLGRSSGGSSSSKGKRPLRVDGSDSDEDEDEDGLDDEEMQRAQKRRK